jgi:magnesium transporter
MLNRRAMETTTRLLLPDVSAALRTDPSLVVEMTEELHPADLADLCAALDDDLALLLIKALPVEEGARLLEAMAEDRRSPLIEQLANADSSRTVEMIEEMAPDDAADVIAELPQATQDALLDKLEPEESRDIRQLMSYPEGTAGAIMTTNFVTVAAEMSILEAIEKIRRQAEEMETINYAYAVDPNDSLLGVVSLRDLVVARADKKIADIMEPNVIAVNDDDEQQEVVRVSTKYGLMAVPVVNKLRHMVGIVTVDDVVGVVEEEATEDIQKFGGMEALDAPYLTIGFISMVKKRAGWLAALFLGEMLTATAMANYEEQMKRAVVLALFVPLIISSGGNSGSQASTLVIRAMALGELKLSDWWRVVRREVGAGAMLGLVLGAIGFARIIAWQAITPTYGPHYMMVAGTVFFSLIGVVLFGTMTGSILPLVLRRIGFDPASASAPFVATLVDVTGLIIYFTVASVIMGGTLM